ncbi:trifunctional serine/threonine-protein kinase/ATP-binding protein/sensor histidine kinase [Desulfosediminicola sp.]|uniref:ATP-binding sensor histidine kinase n=1 Tax=Desulfosediminicola sp. TaxID=2886825 RepID=UPI003AF2943B
MSSIVGYPASQAAKSAFTFSPALYGRWHELQLLRKGLQNAHHGSAVFTMISGEAGIGKSALARVFLTTAASKTTFVLSSSIQRRSESTPYAATSHCLRQLARQILSRDPDVIASWKKALQRTIKGDARVLAEICPEIEDLLPASDEHDEVPPQEQLSFPIAAKKFIRAASQAHSTLIIFIDDLHLADRANLELLINILDPTDLSRVMFIAAHRDPAHIYPSHFSEFTEQLKTLHPKVDQIQVAPLGAAEVEKLLHNAFIRFNGNLSSLVSHCNRITGGNPLRLIQFLHKLHDDAILYRDQESNSWAWIDENIAVISPLESTITLLKNRLATLPEQCQKLLVTACCSGKYFTIRLLSELNGVSLDTTREQLQYAVQLGFLVQDSPDNLIAANSGVTCSPASEDQPEECTYCFSHEMIRDTLFSQLAAEEVSRIRFRVGQYLVQFLPTREYERRLYEVSNHLNHSLKFIGSRDERVQLAHVNLSAGIKAKLLSDHSSAYHYLQTGLKCLDHDSWQGEYSLCIGLHIEACDCAFLCAKYSEVERLFREVCDKSKNIYDKCHVYKAYIMALKAQNQYDKAFSASLEALAMLDIHIPRYPGRLKAWRSLLSTEFRYMFRSPRQLDSLPEMQDRTARAIISFLYDVTTAALLTNSQLLPLLSAHSIRLSLKWGNDRRFSILGYMVHGFLLCTFFSDKLVRRGCARGNQALDLQKKISGTNSNCQPTLMYNVYMAHWQSHLKNTLPKLREMLLNCQRQYDGTSAGNATFTIIMHSYLLGHSLSLLRSELDHFISRATETRQQLILTRLQMFRQATANLMGESENHIRLKGNFFDESALLAGFPHSHDPISYCMANVVKLIHAVLFGRYKHALYYSELARPHVHKLTSTFLYPVYVFYDCLARITRLKTQSITRRLINLQLIRSNTRKLRRWATLSPQNHGHRYRLIEAELARIKGKTERAMELYDEAIQFAKEHEFLHEEALAYELASRFYKNRKKEHIARMYMREARYCYHRWGAKAKVSQLNSMEIVNGSPYEGSDSGTVYDSNDHATSLIPVEGGSRLDMMTVIKASRILSDEVVFGELLKKMMWIVLESSRAQRGFLILKDDDEWYIRVHGSIYRNSRVKLTRTSITEQDVASPAIINYVINSATDIVLNDACKEGLFTSDPYILKKMPRSLLCMPIIHQGEIFCILYLENNIVTGAFPPDRQELLHLLGTQAAISLKNSSLFEELESTVNRLNLEVEKRRETQLQLLHAEKLSALGRLSASVAHEFGNPLMGVRYLIEDFYKRHDLSNADKQLLELGLEECGRMKKLIQDLQRFNKPSTGRFDTVDIHQLIDKVLLFQRKHFATNRIRVAKTYDNSMEDILLIEDQLTQVLFNLTMNAVDAMRQYGGELRISTKKGDETIEIEVADTGAGIAYEDQGRIFEPFYSTKKQEDGTGLGLAISYGIIKHHNGSLNFVSKPFEGTAFTISLPAVTSGDAAATSPDQPSQAPPDTKPEPKVSAGSGYTPEQLPEPVQDF